MIIGAIISTKGSATAPSDNFNGSSLLHFYTMDDAVTWAQMQSSNFAVEQTNLYSLCTVINTDTAQRRWWYNGQEYTG